MTFSLKALGTVALVASAAFQSAAAVTVYYDNSDSQFSPVHIHYWSNPSSDWPGEAMTLVEGNIYSFTFKGTPDSKGGFLFCNGKASGGDQTADCKGAPKDGHIYKGTGSKGAVEDLGEYDPSGPAKPSVTATPAGGTRFYENIVVSLTASLDASIHYTVDGTEPTEASALYSSAFTFTETTTLRTLAVTSEGGKSLQSFVYTKRRPVQPQDGSSLQTDYFKINPHGQSGTNRTVDMTFTKVSNDNRICVADNALSHWSEADMICQGVARDIASSIKGKHEYPVIDSYAVYASYDADNLYLGVQYVYSTWDLYGDGKADNLRAKPYQMDGRFILAFDLDPNKEFDGVLTNGNTIWDEGGKFNSFANGTDCLLYCSTKSTVGVPGLFFPTPDGHASYDAAYCKSIPAPFYGCQDGLLGDIDHIWAQGEFGYDPENLFTNDDFVDIIKEVPKDQHTFYEWKLPLSLLGINENHIKETGIGVMVIDTYGQGAIGSTPYDPTTLDNANTSYSKDPSTSAEKEDHDIFTYRHARIGYLDLSGVESPATDAFEAECEPEYYTLQGVKTNTPGKGLYIVRQGNKAKKVML